MQRIKIIIKVESIRRTSQEATDYDKRHDTAVAGHQTPLAAEHAG